MKEHRVFGNLILTPFTPSDVMTKARLQCTLWRMIVLLSVIEIILKKYFPPVLQEENMTIKIFLILSYTV